MFKTYKCNRFSKKTSISTAIPLDTCKVFSYQMQIVTQIVLEHTHTHTHTDGTREMDTCKVFS